MIFLIVELTMLSYVLKTYISNTLLTLQKIWLVESMFFTNFPVLELSFFSIAHESVIHQGPFEFNYLKK